MAQTDLRPLRTCERPQRARLRYFPLEILWAFDEEDQHLCLVASGGIPMEG
jgi:hypothetical protein